MMEKDPKILTEIQEISPLLAKLHGINVFNVPEGYFSTFSDNILAKVDGPAISLEKENPMQVPEGYFETLSSNILLKIKSADEDNELEAYPVLMVEGKQKVFKIPEGYFEHLSGNIIEKIKNEKKARVISFDTKKIWRYAAAAVIAVGVFVTSYFVIGFQHGNKGFAVVTNKTVPDPNALKYNSAKAFNQGIASLSDDQIIDYLEDHGNILDIDLLIKNTDSDELPDASDYLMNDEALTNYLQKINNKGNEKQ